MLCCPLRTAEIILSNQAARTKSPEIQHCARRRCKVLICAISRYWTPTSSNTTCMSGAEEVKKFVTTRNTSSGHWARRTPGPSTLHGEYCFRYTAVQCTPLSSIPAQLRQSLADSPPVRTPVPSWHTAITWHFVTLQSYVIVMRSDNKQL